MATTRPLEDAEIQKLFASIEGRHAVRNRTMLTLGIAAALRATELVSLRVGDVYDGGEVRAYIKVRAETAKFGKERVIRIGGAVREAVSTYLWWKIARKQPVTAEKPLFVSQKGGALTRQMLYTILKGILDRAGIDQSPHALRKTGAMIYYQESHYDIEATRHFLGHADLSTTRKYLGLDTAKIIDYSERTAAHLKAAIAQGEMAKFDTRRQMSNYDLSSIPTPVLTAELEKRRQMRESPAQEGMIQPKFEATAHDGKVIRFPKTNKG